MILSSFYWGYVITLVPSIYLVKKFGGKWVYGFGMFSTTTFTFLTPVVTETYGSTGLIVIRAIMGCGEAGEGPGSFAMVARWAPPNERTKMVSFMMSGLQLGSILGTALSGVLIKHSSIGWPIAFYVFGGLGVLWLLAYVVLVYDDPDEHPFISQEEKDYLRETMKAQTHKETPIPWRHMVTSAPVWALFTAYIGKEWIFQLMMTDLPKYMSNVLKFPIDANGFLSALPNVVMWLFSFVFSWSADWLIKNNKLSRKNVRKILVTISTVGPAVLIISASYAGYDYSSVVVLFAAAMGMMGASYSGVLVNPIDLSPNHTSTLVSVATIIASLCGLLVPYCIGILTTNQALLEWRTVFWITFCVLSVSSLIFNTLGDAEVQYWNDLNSSSKKHNGTEVKERQSFLKITDQEIR